MDHMLGWLEGNIPRRFMVLGHAPWHALWWGLSSFAGYFYTTLGKVQTKSSVPEENHIRLR